MTRARARLRGLLVVTVALVLLGAGAAWAAWTDTQQAVAAETSSYVVPPVALSCTRSGATAVVEWTRQTAPVPLDYEATLDGAGATVSTVNGQSTITVTFTHAFGTRARTVQVTPFILGNATWRGPSSSRTAESTRFLGVTTQLTCD